MKKKNRKEIESLTQTLIFATNSLENLKLWLGLKYLKGVFAKNERLT